MSNQNYANPDNVDITSVFGRVRRSLPRLIIWSVVLGGLTFAVLSFVAPRFQSQAEIQVTARDVRNPFVDPTRDGPNRDVLTAQLDREAINTHINALKSRDLARDIAKKLNLGDQREFDPALGPEDLVGKVLRLVGIGAPNGSESKEDRVLNAYFKRLEVFSPKESRVIGVRMSSSSAQRAADISNAIVTTYRERLASQTIVETDTVQRALEPQIASLRKEVAEAEKAVRQFQAKTDTYGEGGQRTPLNEQQLNELTQELTRAKAARSEAEARASAARELASNGSADANADVLRSPLIQSLSEQRVGLERERSQLSATLLPGHPNMRRVNADLASLKRQIKREVRKVVDSLDKEARIARLREQSIKNDLAAIKTKVVDTSGDQVKLRALEATAKAKNDELGRLLAQFESNRANVRNKVVPAVARVITKARPASVPVYPKKAPMAGLVSLATFFLGLAWVVTGALIAGSRSSGGGTPQSGRQLRDDGEADVSLVQPSQTAAKGQDGPSLARVLPQKQADAGPQTSSSATGKVGNIDELFAHVQGIAPGTGGFRTMIAGENNAIDAGNEAVDLALKFSASGKNTILVDWSTDGKGVVQKIGLPVSPGVTELLSGEATFEDTIRQVPNGNLHVISCGDSALDSAILKDPDRLNLVLDALDEAYDHIVVVGTYDAARSLFETIEGRFDAGVIVGDVKGRVAIIQDPPGTFLGFEVADIALVRYERGSKPSSPAQRIVRADQPKGPELRPS